MPKEDFILENVRIMRYDNIQKLFCDTYKDLDFEKRINEVKKHIFSKIKNNKDVIEKTIIQKRTFKINKMLKDDSLSEEEKRQKRIEIFEESEDVLKKLDRDNMNIVNFYFNKINKKDCLELYKDFINNYVFDHIDNEIIGSYLVRNTMKNLNNGEITFEDLAPIIYIHYKVFGT